MSSRSLRSYLVLPRPGDVGKSVVLPAGVLLGVAGTGSTAHLQPVRAVVVWLALELLVYQARYQWNDLRGAEADRRHPDAASRGRLPDTPSPRAAARASRVVLGTRLGLAAVLPLLPVAAVAVLAVAALYEGLRSAATGRSGQVPPPLRPALRALWAAVGAGYAVRGLTGFALAVPVSGHPALTVATGVGAWAGGAAWATSRWALEGLAHARLHGATVRWSATQRQAREHLLGLVRWVPDRPDPRDLPYLRDLPGGGTRRDVLPRWRALHGRTPTAAPWNVGTVVAGAAAGLSGRLLVGSVQGPEVVVAVLLGAAGAYAVVRAERRRLVATALLAAAGAALQVAAGLDRPLPALLPWLLVALVHASSAAQDLEVLGHPGARAARLLARRDRPRVVPVVLGGVVAPARGSLHRTAPADPPATRVT